MFWMLNGASKKESWAWKVGRYYSSINGIWFLSTQDQQIEKRYLWFQETKNQWIIGSLTILICKYLGIRRVQVLIYLKYGILEDVIFQFFAIFLLFLILFPFSFIFTCSLLSTSSIFFSFLFFFLIWRITNIQSIGL